MDEKSSKEVLRKLGQHGVTLEDLAQLGDIHMCYAKDSTELEDPVGWYGWEFLEGIGIISDDRLTALEAGAEPTDREMQLFREACWTLSAAQRPLLARSGHTGRNTALASRRLAMWEVRQARRWCGSDWVLTGPPNCRTENSALTWRQHSPNFALCDHLHRVWRG